MDKATGRPADQPVAGTAPSASPGAKRKHGGKKRSRAEGGSLAPEAAPVAAPVAAPEAAPTHAPTNVDAFAAAAPPRASGKFHPRLFEIVGQDADDEDDEPTPFASADPAVLSDRDIAAEVRLGNVVIEPFNPAQLNSCSYDVTLGSAFYRADPARLPPAPGGGPGVFNPWCPAHVHAYWGPPCRASSLAERGEAGRAAEFGLSPTAPFILLAPGETILAHTVEFIGGRRFITTMLRARSSMGRSNVTVCRDAGWGDIGYVNRWTLQVSNLSGAPLVLPVGARVAQLVFLYSSEPASAYGGSYQDSPDVAELQRRWNPADMLPKLKAA